MFPPEEVWHVDNRIVVTIARGHHVIRPVVSVSQTPAVNNRTTRDGRAHHNRAGMVVKVVGVVVECWRKLVRIGIGPITGRPQP